jgi:hypothetical protein
LRPACALLAVCALIIEPVRAEAPAELAGALHARHSESSPLVGDASLAMHARMPWPPFAQAQGTRSPTMQASPVNAGGSGSLGGSISCSGSLP